MNRIKKAMRFFLFIIFIVLAAFGLGLAGNLFPNQREKYLDNEIRIEQTEKKEDDEEEDDRKE
jgi:hypothetical protein